MLIDSSFTISGMEVKVKLCTSGILDEKFLNHKILTGTDDLKM